MHYTIRIPANTRLLKYPNSGSVYQHHLGTPGPIDFVI